MENASERYEKFIHRAGLFETRATIHKLEYTRIYKKVFIHTHTHTQERYTFAMYG